MNRIMPTTYVRSAALVSCFLLAVGCGSSGLGPEPTESVSIHLEVTGGLAGVDYAFTVDGSEGVVRGERCVSGCDFLGGDVLLQISSDQIRNLSEMLLDAGLMQLDQSDYGTQCCDQFHYALEYRDDERERNVQGSSEALPGTIRSVLGVLHHLAQGVAPLIVAFDSQPQDWPGDAVTLNSSEIVGSLLSLDVSYGGGCQTHHLDLVAWGGWQESEPVQVRVLLAHDAHNDMCEAWLTETLRFDLGTLRRAYESAYGSSADGQGIVLRLQDSAAVDPPGVRLITYTF
jgi:hypothetical protein